MDNTTTSGVTNISPITCADCGRFLVEVEHVGVLRSSRGVCGTCKSETNRDRVGNTTVRTKSSRAVDDFTKPMR